MKRIFQTDKFQFTYSENHVESHVLWENHCHARYEMIAVLEGDISIMLAGRCYRLRENQIIMIPPLLYHAITANKEGDYKRITAFFDISSVPTVLHSDFMQHDTELTIFTSPLLQELRLCCQKEDTAYYEPLVESLMIPLFYGRLKAPITNREDAEADDFVLKIIAYIDEHLCDKILLDDLARHTARSKSFVCHLFEEKMGIPPKQYILQKKMAFANKLIREGHPPTLVAAQIGYKNYGTFYRIYHKHFGTNPLNTKSIGMYP